MLKIHHCDGTVQLLRDGGCIRLPGGDVVMNVREGYERDGLKVVRHEPQESEPPEPSYEERVAQALDSVAPLPVLVKEIILAMNHAQLSKKLNWSGPMDAIINRTLAELGKADALEREE